MATLDITVPEAGKSKSFGLTGLSVLVLAAPSYFSPNEAAKLSFDNAGGGLPALNRNIYPSDKGEFKKIVVTGTPESAGDKITLLTINNCVEPVISSFSAPNKTVCGTTIAKDSTDAGQSLSDLELQKDGRLPAAMYITARINDLNFAFNKAVDQTKANHLLKVDELIKIEGLDFIQKFSFASAAAGTAGKLVITPEY